MSKKGDKSGMTNAQHHPYRFHGGSHDRPAFNPLARAASTVPGSDYRQTANFASGMQGGVLAGRLGYGFTGYDGWNQMAKQAAE